MTTLAISLWADPSFWWKSSSQFTLLVFLESFCQSAYLLVGTSCIGSFFSQSIIMIPGASQVIDAIFFPESLRAQWQWRWSLPKYRLVLSPWIKAINPNRIHGHETRIELLKICPWNTSPVFLLFILLHSSYPSSGHFFMENSFGVILVCYHMGSLASQLNVWRSVIHQPWVQRETWIFGRI